ncbi:MAG TPA: LamG-like jellyroll fold domain-containing protein, partial [Labilithrix sp.]
MASFRSVVPVVLGVVIAACGSSSSSGGGTPDAGGGADSGPGGDSGPGTPPPGSTDAGSDAMSDSGCTGTLTALHFTTNDTVTIADAASLSMGAAGTIEAWVLLDAPGAGGIVHGLIYDKWVSAVEDKSLGVEANGLYAGGIFESVSSTRSVEAIDPSSAGKWTHVAMSYDATSMRLFVD